MKIELYKFTTTEGGIPMTYRWTDGPEAVSWNGETWEPKELERSNIKVNSKLADAGGITVRIDKDSPVVTAFFRNRHSNPIGLTIYQGDPADLLGTVENLWLGEVGKVRRSSPAQLTCEPVVTINQRQLPVGRFTRSCRWQLYSPACGVDADSLSVRELFTATALHPELKAIEANASTAGLGDGWANGGIYWDHDTGIKIFVKRSEEITTTSHLIYLKQWPEFTVSASGDFYVKAGCDHTMSDCNDKFANIHNFGGFPVTPDDRDLSHTFGVEA